MCLEWGVSPETGAGVSWAVPFLPQVGSCFQLPTAFPCGELDFTFLLDFSGSVVVALAGATSGDPQSTTGATSVTPKGQVTQTPTAMGMVGLARF